MPAEKKSIYSHTFTPHTQTFTHHHYIPLHSATPPPYSFASTMKLSSQTRCQKKNCVTNFTFHPDLLPFSIPPPLSLFPPLYLSLFFLSLPFFLSLSFSLSSSFPLFSPFLSYSYFNTVSRLGYHTTSCALLLCKCLSPPFLLPSPIAPHHTHHWNERF